MSDNLDKYVPEFEEEEARDKLAGATSAQLTDMLIYSYKLLLQASKSDSKDARSGHKQVKRG